MKGQAYSILSGLFAAFGSLCGKFSMASEEALWLCETAYSYIDGSTHSVYPECKNVVLYIRLLFFGLTFLLNAIMWTTFLKALRYSTTSLEATVTNTAANFFFTAIFGQVLFGEFLTLVWWIGTLLIIFGLLLIHQGNQHLSAISKSGKML